VSFWNKVQAGVSRAAAEAEKQARITRINLQIGEVQGAIKRKHEELGDVALELARAGKLEDPRVGPIVEAIGTEEARLAQFREQLAEAQGSGAAADSTTGAEGAGADSTTTVEQPPEHT
jgi:hypothetical protein